MHHKLCLRSAHGTFQKMLLTSHWEVFHIEEYLILLIVSNSASLNIATRSRVLLQKHPVSSCQLGSLKARGLTDKDHRRTFTFSQNFAPSTYQKTHSTVCLSKGNQLAGKKNYLTPINVYLLKGQVQDISRCMILGLSPECCRCGKDGSEYLSRG